MWFFPCSLADGRMYGGVRMRGDATPIKEIISSLSSERFSRQERVKRAWHRATEKRFWPHAQPVSFRKKRLVVNVDSSGWLYELTMKKKNISARLQRILKDDFKELQFRIGKIER